MQTIAIDLDSIIHRLPVSFPCGRMADTHKVIDTIDDYVTETPPRTFKKEAVQEMNNTLFPVILSLPYSPFSQFCFYLV